jgi:uncharacterized iron-regulated membrane protein
VGERPMTGIHERESSLLEPGHETKISVWQQWLQHPEKLGIHRLFFQIHLWLGMIAGLYVFVMSVSGSLIVYRNAFERSGNESSLVRVVEWFVALHENLLFGTVGRAVNGVGAICVTLLCLTGAIIWWPGIAHWRRSLTVNWKASFARVNWDLHSTFGFWCFLFVILWGVSGIYFAFPQPFNALFELIDPGDKFADQTLSWLSNLHFGRFGWFAEAIWSILGLVLAVLAFTGLFMCCHRLFVRKGAPLPR